MKSTLLSAACTMFLLIGCASTKGTKDDYFGYSNSPKIETEEQAPRRAKPKEIPTAGKTVTEPTAQVAENDGSSDQDWVNPLSDSETADYQDNDDPNYATSATAVGYRPYIAPAYVPVMVPWWDYYSGWMGGYYARPAIVVRYRNWFWGWNSYCDWYSPYYDYHPCYGVSFGYYRPFYSYRGFSPYWRPWHHYPIYSYHPVSPVARTPKSIRTWGTGSGVPSASPVGGKNSVNTPSGTTTPSPIRNERGQSSSGSGITPRNPVSNPVREQPPASNTPVRTERPRETPKNSVPQNNDSKPKANPNPKNDAPIRKERPRSDIYHSTPQQQYSSRAAYSASHQSFSPSYSGGGGSGGSGGHSSSAPIRTGRRP